jgi:hypothetical protein
VSGFHRSLVMQVSNSFLFRLLPARLIRMHAVGICISLLSCCLFIVDENQFLLTAERQGNYVISTPNLFVVVF